MTTPPDFGGEEIARGREEDLRVPVTGAEAESEDDTDLARPDDNEAHAAGEACALCGKAITAGQDARRRADGRWVHEVCP